MWKTPMEECYDSVSKEIANLRVHMTGIAPNADVPYFHCGPSKTENLKWMVRDSKKVDKLVSKRKIFKKLTWKMKVVKLTIMMMIMIIMMMAIIITMIIMMIIVIYWYSQY